MQGLAIVIDCADAERLATFWSAALGYRRRGALGPYVGLAPPEGEPGPRLILQRVPEPKSGKNRVHLDIDLRPDDDLDAEVARLVALGATALPDGDVDELGARWVRLADPEGNELCVCRDHPS